MTDGLVIAAPSSGSGKTVITLGLLRALRRRGIAVSGAKVGPDYIDPSFHAAAVGRPAHNLDVWAMRPSTLGATVEESCGDVSLMIAEGVMGLFDGIGSTGAGSTADLAQTLGWPVVMVIDARGAAASVAATLHGFSTFRPGLEVAGVIANRVGSVTHGSLIEDACREHCPDIAWLGAVRRDQRLVLPERHLGLVQAVEHPELEEFIELVADTLEQSIDLGRLTGLARPARAYKVQDSEPPLPPLGQRIAVAQDAAFGFTYHGVLAAWQAAGAEILPFSPLSDQGPDASADAVYLCGGYPELHVGRLAQAEEFRRGMRDAASRNAAIYGECGGYMVLGEALIDAGGAPHEMLGLLPLVTTFAERHLHLGYRRVKVMEDSVLGPAGRYFRGHEFHYAGIVSESKRMALFEASDAQARKTFSAGLTLGRIAGSFIHLIDRED